MTRKLGMLLAAVAVVALSVPAFAAANPTLTHEDNTGAFVTAPLGSGILGTSTNTVTKTSIGNLTCATVEVTAELTHNTTGTVAAEGSGPANTATCFFKGTTPITIDDATLLSLHSSESGKGTASLTFEATLPGLTCHYSGAAVPFTYPATGDTIVLKGTLKASPLGCGTASIEGTYTLQTHEVVEENGQEVTKLRKVILH